MIQSLDPARVDPRRRDYKLGSLSVKRLSKLLASMNCSLSLKKAGSRNSI